MWVFTRHGFFSIVKHNTEPDTMLVRTRVREDLEDAFGPDGIIENEGSDYRFRKSVPSQEVADYLAEEVLDIDYTSVKDNIDKDEDDRHKMLYAVWGAHFDLQRNRYGDREWGEVDYEFVWKDFAPA